MPGSAFLLNHFYLIILLPAFITAVLMPGNFLQTNHYKEMFQPYFILVEAANNQTIEEPA